jgi:spore coat protein A
LDFHFVNRPANSASVRPGRRKFLRNGLSAATGLILPSGLAAQHQPTPVGTVDEEGVLLESFIDPLPIPPVLRPPLDVRKPLSMRMSQFRQKVHRDLPPTMVWGYEGTWPGPTIEVRRDRPASIRWINNLPENHLLPIDTSIHGAEGSLPQVRTVTHVHGAAVHPDDDGFPESWFSGKGVTGPTFKLRPSLYPNGQPAATLWYHDHCLGITRLNVYAGLAGCYIIRDETEDALNLPRGRFDIPLMIQDRSFRKDGSLLYPKAVNGTHPIWVQEYFGNVICVNGRVAPFVDVEPRRYRFRLINGSNARYYRLRLRMSDLTGKNADRTADTPDFQQIGADGGLMPAPVHSRYLLIAPGERMDVILDFSEFKGKSFVMLNDALAPFTMGGDVIPPDVMLFRVAVPLSGKDTSTVPNRLAPFEALNPAHADQERLLPISEIERPSDDYVVIGLLGKARWHDPVTEDPKAGSTEIWSFINSTPDVHPIHIHLVRFQVLNRQPFDLNRYLRTGNLEFTGEPLPPESNERPAIKDTVKAYPGHVTRIIQRFDLPKGVEASPGKEFLYVWHCHILEHEDNEMMRPYKVIA